MNQWAASSIESSDGLFSCERIAHILCADGKTRGVLIQTCNLRTDLQVDCRILQETAEGVIIRFPTQDAPTLTVAKNRLVQWVPTVTWTATELG